MVTAPCAAASAYVMVAECGTITTAMERISSRQNPLVRALPRARAARGERRSASLLDGEHLRRGGARTPASRSTPSRSPSGWFDATSCWRSSIAARAGRRRRVVARARTGAGGDEPGRDSRPASSRSPGCAQSSLDDALRAAPPAGPAPGRRPGRRQRRRDRAGRRRLRRHRHHHDGRHRGSVRMEGAARRDGQHVPRADRDRVSRSRRRSNRCKRQRDHDRRRGAARRARRCPTRDLRGPLAVVLGAEGAGLPEAIVAAADVRASRSRCALRSSRSTSPSPRPDTVRSRASREPQPLMSLFDEPDSARRAARIDAARRAHASAHARRVRRPGDAARARTPAAPGDRARPPAVDHPLGPARHRQDDARAAHRRA